MIKRDKELIVVGASVNEVPLGPPGDTRAFDAITGRKLWEFHTVPRPGETGHETWLDDGWKDRSGTNTWGFSEREGVRDCCTGGACNAKPRDKRSVPWD